MIYLDENIKKEISNISNIIKKGIIKKLYKNLIF